MHMAFNVYFLQLAFQGAEYSLKTQIQGLVNISVGKNAKDAFQSCRGHRFSSQHSKQIAHSSLYVVKDPEDWTTSGLHTQTYKYKIKIKYLKTHKYSAYIL